MQEPALLAEQERSGIVPTDAACGFTDSLRELVRSGYAVDPEGEGEGLLLRHKVGPDLILHDDGMLSLAVSQPKKKSKGWRAKRGDAPRRIYWRRTFAVAFVGTVAWSMSVLLGVALLSG